MGSSQVLWRTDKKYSFNNHQVWTLFVLLEILKPVFEKVDTKVMISGVSDQVGHNLAYSAKNSLIES